jgi:hypothetical protein
LIYLQVSPINPVSYENSMTRYGHSFLSFYNMV